VVPFFRFKDYALASCASQYLQAHWQTAHQNKLLPLYVPEDCKTLKEAVKRVIQDSRITTIVLGKGDHQIDGRYLEISSAMRIVGRPDVPKEKIVVVGGIHFKNWIEGNCHLQHMIIRQAKADGVLGGSSFTMEDVIVEQCGERGVRAYNDIFGGGRLTNVEVRQCGGSGLVASWGAYITLIGAKTKVHHNCTKCRDHYPYSFDERSDYGLEVRYSDVSTIQLVYPLTKEQVSIDNDGGGNWGADEGDINQITTIAATASPSFNHASLTRDESDDEPGSDGGRANAANAAAATAAATAATTTAAATTAAATTAAAAAAVGATAIAIHVQYT
jgi:hypothetical protein